MNVPPGQVENLLQELDIRLVFTAHPTEIVRHTVRHKQRRVAHLLQRLQSEMPIARQDEDNLRRQLEEEIRLWWRTDELHQFKPTVLDEVDSTLHYFQQVLFAAMPQLRRRASRQPEPPLPGCAVPPGVVLHLRLLERIGPGRQPLGDPGDHLAYRLLPAPADARALHRLCAGANQLSISMQWSQVAPQLLESLEMDRLRFPEVYEERAARYRLEPYRLKLSYILERLELTLVRNNQLSEAGWQTPKESPAQAQRSDVFRDMKPCTTPPSISSAAILN